MSWSISKLSIRGVKGVLDKAGHFDLSNNKSIAIFARNSCGKSGYADALEYLFSPDGEVEHLGKGGADSEHGGKHALPHVLAEQRNIAPEISINLHCSTPPKTLEVTRTVQTGRIDPIPSELNNIVSVAPAHRILRQHDLRRFVVDMDPRAKYSELSRWLGLQRLEDVLSHLTTTENELAKVDPDREFDERLQDIPKHTNNAINTYDVTSTLKWCADTANNYLPSPTIINSLSDLNTCIELLKERRNDLVQRSGRINENYQAKISLEKYVSDLPSDESQLKICNNALETAVLAEQNVEAVKEQAKDSVFQDVWNSSKNLLDKQTLDVCPICLTPWDKTQLGSQSKSLVNISDSLSSLNELAQAQSQLRNAITKFYSTTKSLDTYLRNLETESNKLAIPQIPKHASDIVKKVQDSSREERSPSQVQNEFKEIFQEIQKLIETDLASSLNSITIEGVPEPAAEVDELINHLSVLRDTLSRLTELQSEREEYKEIRQGFSLVSTTIQREAALLLNKVVEALRYDLKNLFRKIHPSTDIPDIYLKPDTTTKTLTLRVDFHSPGRTVPPAGYLSESHINTIGLALFISCARLFNREFPFIFLDDIVSSYDADHRARVVDVIAEDLSDFQVFITTHDEMFYTLLKSRLIDKGWEFERITDWKLEEGPIRESDAIKPDQINLLIQKNDQNAGNTVRQYMEEWLDKMCVRYSAYTLHKRPPHEFDRTIFDYWGPFVDRIKKMKGNFFQHRVENAICYQRLSTHSIINYYNHYQANPYKWPSKGDIEYVWEEFQEFTNLFQCYSCPKILEYSHDRDRLYCTCGEDIFPP